MPENRKKIISEFIKAKAGELGFFNVAFLKRIF